jgi:predicted O-methyltransferase YrrM
MHQLVKYIGFFFTAGKGSIIARHAGFAADLYNNCLKSSKHSTNRTAERIRKQVCRSGEVIEVTDYGAGTRKKLSANRPVSKIMRQTAINRKSGQVLAALAAYFKPKLLIELGTGPGISTMYLAGGNPSASIITIEGSREIARLAERNFVKAGYQNIVLREGRFSEILPAVLSVPGHPLMVFIDGDHRENSLLENISMLSSSIQDDSIIIIDDIHLSQEMERAWKKIIAMPEVRLSIDLFRLGLLFFREEMQKQHLMLKI